MAKNEKSMTLEQFKTELETDATKRNCRQEETIMKQLIADNKKKDDELMNLFSRLLGRCLHDAKRLIVVVVLYACFADLRTIAQQHSRSSSDRLNLTRTYIS